MKNKIILLLTFLCILLSGSVFSSTAMNLNTNVNQYYTLMFDKDGEAVVNFALEYSNMEEEDVSSITMEFPHKELEFFGVVQDVSSKNVPVCTNWEEKCLEFGKGQTCIRYDYNGNCEEYGGPCLKSEKQCTRYYTPPSNYAVYERIDYDIKDLSNSKTITFNLKAPIKKMSKSKIFMLYKVKDISRDNIGLINYNFQTAKIDIITTNLRVSTNFPQGFYTKGKKSRNTYFDSNFESVSQVMGSTTQFDKSMNDQLRNYVGRVGVTGHSYDSASYLDPHESHTVKGSYSDSWFRLYLINIIIGLAILCAILVGIVLGIKKLMGYMSEILSKKTVKKGELPAKQQILIPFLTGLFSALILFLIIGLTIVCGNIIDNYFYGIGGLIILLVVLFSFLMSMFILIGVPIYMGVKTDALTGLMSAAAILGWVFLLSVLAVFGLFFISMI